MKKSSSRLTHLITKQSNCYFCQINPIGGSVPTLLRQESFWNHFAKSCTKVKIHWRSCIDKSQQITLILFCVSRRGSTLIIIISRTIITVSDLWSMTWFFDLKIECMSCRSLLSHLFFDQRVSCCQSNNWIRSKGWSNTLLTSISGFPGKKSNEQETWHWEQSVSCLSWSVCIMTWQVNRLCSRSFIHDNENLSLNQFLFDFHQQSKRTSHSRKKLSITHILFYHRCHTLVTCHVKECHIIWVTCSLGVSSCQSKEWITFANDSAI